MSPKDFLKSKKTATRNAVKALDFLKEMGVIDSQTAESIKMCGASNVISQFRTNPTRNITIDQLSYLVNERNVSGEYLLKDHKGNLPIMSQGDTYNNNQEITAEVANAPMGKYANVFNDKINTLIQTDVFKNYKGADKKELIDGFQELGEMVRKSMELSAEKMDELKKLLDQKEEWINRLTAENELLKSDNNTLKDKLIDLYEKKLK